MNENHRLRTTNNRLWQWTRIRFAQRRPHRMWLSHYGRGWIDFPRRRSIAQLWGWYETLIDFVVSNVELFKMQSNVQKAPTTTPGAPMKASRNRFTFARNNQRDFERWFWQSNSICISLALVMELCKETSLLAKKIVHRKKARMAFYCILWWMRNLRKICTKRKIVAAQCTWNANHSRPETATNWDPSRVGGNEAAWERKTTNACDTKQTESVWCNVTKRHSNDFICYYFHWSQYIFVFSFVLSTLWTEEEVAFLFGPAILPDSTRLVCNFQWLTQHCIVLCFVGGCFWCFSFRPSLSLRARNTVRCRKRQTSNISKTIEVKNMCMHSMAVARSFTK